MRYRSSGCFPARPAPTEGCRWSLSCKVSELRCFAIPCCLGAASMKSNQPTWIKDPLAILADGAERGVVVQDGKIVELVAAGRSPATPDAASFDASQHVVL